MIRLENGRRISGKLHQLSITGGLLELATCLEERARVRMTIYLDSSFVHPAAEMMFPMRGAIGYLQPFRLTSLQANERQILEKEITALLKQTTTTAATAHSSGFRPPRYYLESF
jgi:hypothetical protein